ncbi:MAG TPA: invasin domain 3-containing protein, partial [Thermoanaerobaculia bacterium]
MSLLPAVGCDKATPVAPDGTILTISANPSQVALNGRSTITVVGRKPDGNPLNPGTEIRLTAARGTIDSIVTTDNQGRATATFRADGRAGEVEITASTGGGDTMAETTVQVGLSDTDRPDVLVSVTPSTVAIGTSAEVTVIARNSDGSEVAQGTPVILTTTLGNISPSRVTVGRDGRATATLNAGQREGTATVTAVVGSSDPATATVEIILDLATGITVTANPSSIPETGGTITVTALVTNSRGLPVEGALVTFESDLGTFGNN